MPLTDPPPLHRSASMYTLMRVVLFVGAFGLCLIIGLDTPLAIVCAVILSGVVSFFMLRTQREHLTEAMIARRDAKLAAKQRRRDALGED